tara:strand:+ start:786 stop:2558 length:1773 start_codon:yes stop_codon:yes gene_type:complete
MKSLLYLNKYFVKYSVKLAFGLLFIILANISALFPAHLIGKSFNLIASEINKSQIGSKDFESLYYYLSMYAALLILFAILRGVFMFYMRQNIIVVSRFIEYDLKNEIYKHYQNLSFNFYKKNNIGDLLNRITEDVSRVRMYLGPAIMYSLNLITLIILILYRMLTVSPELTLIVLSPLPILSLLIYKVSHRINLKSNIVQQKLSTLTNTAQEAFAGIRLVKSFVREKEIVQDFDTVNHEYMRENIQLSKISAVFFPLISLLVGASILLTIYVGGLSTMNNLITVGDVAEFIIYVNMLTWPATSIGWVTEVIQRASSSQERINEFLNNVDYTQFFQDNSKESILKKQIQNIHASELYYKYSNSKKTAISGVDFTIHLNSITGFVGHIGSGKTTILQLITGLLKPSSGQILFNQIESQNFNWFEFRNMISYVSQDVFLFSDSIRNNILFGVKNISNKDLLYITDQLCILNEINRFKNGFDTIIGEGGITLSGGQKQRIALARAIIRKPKVLILDDAFSNVDSETEIKIINYIKSQLKNTAIVLTSNRLSVLSFCDQIYVLKSGKIIQKGLHLELIDQSGEYQKLFSNQMLSK